MLMHRVHGLICHVMVCLGIGIILIAPSSVCSQEKTDTDTIKVIGKSTKSEENPTVAREAAIANGLSAAVEQVIVEIVPEDLLIRRFDGVMSLIRQQTETFVRGYKVLAEKQVDSGYQVLLAAVVLRSRLKAAIDQAGVLTKKTSQPVLLFLITEQYLGKTAPRYWWHPEGADETMIVEDALVHEMGAKGYRMADRSAFTSEKYDTAALNATAATDIGRQLHADVVITGEAMVGKAKETKVTDLKTYKGTLTVRAYRTDTGAQIAISHASNVSVNMDDAAGEKSVLSLLAQEVSADLSRQLTSFQELPHKKSFTPIHLRSFVALRRALDAMPDVKRVEIEALTPPTALLIVHFSGSAREMVQQLTEAENDAFHIQIEKTSAGRIDVTLSP